MGIVGHKLQAGRLCGKSGKIGVLCALRQGDSAGEYHDCSKDFYSNKASENWHCRFVAVKSTGLHPNMPHCSSRQCYYYVCNRKGRSLFQAFRYVIFFIKVVFLIVNTITIAVSNYKVSLRISTGV